jgi:hypothetical protein
MAIDVSVTSAWRDAFDRSTHGLIVVDYPHHEIHGGSSFVASGTVDLGNGATMNINVKTPNSTKYSHVVFSVSHELEAAINLYEGFAPSGTADGGTPGVAVSVWNRNRNSSTAATTLVYSGATVGTAGTASAGTLIWAHHEGGGSTPNRFGGESRGISEWVLKANTQYLFQIINATTSANYTAWEVDWYEHTDKE